MSFESSMLQINGIDIFYMEKNGAATYSIVFIHGNSSSSRLWKKQFDDPLLHGYHLLAFDLPAHGNSGSTTDMRVYSATGLAVIMHRAVKAVLHDKPFVIAGFSFGSTIVAEMIAWGFSGRGMALIGSCVVGGGFTLGDIFSNSIDTTPFFTDMPADTAIDDLVAAVTHTKERRDIDLLKEDFKKVKAPFRSALLQNTMNGMVSDEIALLKKSNVPLLVVMGMQDTIVQIQYLDNMPLNYWQHTIFKLDNANHFVPIDQPGRLSALLAQYASDIFSK